ncbi:MAG TPA: TonB-dependent receptor, partial [Candidatus Elarobacter sp.]|nr:TonB-dependent receptor [Candidatus Elarobacter sp.]
RINRNGFGFTAADLRVNGKRDSVLARWWHVSAMRDGPAAGNPFEFRTDDSLTGGSFELDHTSGGNAYSLGATETYGRGSADGLVYVASGAYERVQTAFARAIVHPARNVETQVAVYDVRADLLANGARLVEGGIAARLGVAFRPRDGLTLRGSTGAGFTPPSLVAFAGLRGAPGGVTVASTTDIGLDKHVFDAETTLSLDVFATHESNRLIQDRHARWTNAGDAARRGAEFSLARRPRAGLGYLLQAWTASDTPALRATAGDVASGATHGYAEISYHGAQGSRVSLGATYWGADPLLTQPVVVMLNTNVEIQVGARGKIQFSVENLNDAARAVISRGTPFLSDPSPFAPGPRTVRLLVRRSFGRTGPDGG